MSHRLCLLILLAALLSPGCGRNLTAAQVKQWCKSNCNAVQYQEPSGDLGAVVVRVTQGSVRFGFPIPPRKGYELHFCRLNRVGSSAQVECQKVFPQAGESTVASIDVNPGEWLVRLVPEGTR